MDKISGFTSSSFYKSSDCKKYLPVKMLESSAGVIPYKIKSLVTGPSIIWKVFRKQADALSYVSSVRFYLMAFAFESGPIRLFLVAHPEVFWHYDEQRRPHQRCTYEIIPENTACKLYFDLEFNKDLNNSKNGDFMVQNFIAIVIYYLRNKFKIDCEPQHVLNLDSSTESKFSCHLIFNIPGVCFANNKQAGNFVNFICNEIECATRPNPVTELNFISLPELHDMFVKDSKGNLSLFCDRSVYSRNRHFRIYKSTKWGKNAPLKLSSFNKFKPHSNDNAEKEIFFSSLITYLSEDFESLRSLNFDYNSTSSKIKSGLMSVNSPIAVESVSSPYVSIDEFIKDVVYPGKIYRSCFFPSSRVINYDIIGNRFCVNIGRPHKSNNVKYIVDLKENVYYQKCHDFDCAHYKSEKKPLPEKLKMTNDNDQDNTNLGSFDTPSTQKCSLEHISSCGLSDGELI